jgi:glutamate-1-semialdehyde aminotransferase
LYVIGATSKALFSAGARRDEDLEDYLHVHLADRGILPTPFHNLALTSPVTTEEDVARHHEVVAASLGGCWTDVRGSARRTGGKKLMPVSRSFTTQA